MCGLLLLRINSRVGEMDGRYMTWPFCKLVGAWLTSDRVREVELRMVPLVLPPKQNKFPPSTSSVLK